eukprot:scaffold219129_cov43-Prasinocladus_malaysianus.AAC.1
METRVDATCSWLKAREVVEPTEGGWAAGVNSSWAASRQSQASWLGPVLPSGRAGAEDLTINRPRPASAQAAAASST